MGSVNGSSLLIFHAWFLPFAFYNVYFAIGPKLAAATERSTFIIHMDKSLMPKSFANRHLCYSSTINSLKPAVDPKDHGPSLLYTYNHALHGFSAVLSPYELEILKKAPRLVSAHADKKLTLQTTHTPEFLSLNSDNGLWPASDYGKDIIIGVVDTGVWPESKSFSDDGMTGPIPAKWKGSCQEGEMFPPSTCSSKLIGARYFNKGLRASKPEINISMNSARDTHGHGTHTASTATDNFVTGVTYFRYANGTARGIALHARLAVYKVFWAEGGVGSDYLAGIDQAVANGVDVLSISLGPEQHLNLYENDFAIAAVEQTRGGEYDAF